MKLKFACSALSFLSALWLNAQNINLPLVFSDAEKQTDLMVEKVAKIRSSKPSLVSPRTLQDGKLILTNSSEWTSGFFPGKLWFLYEYTGKTKWKDLAHTYTALIEKEKSNGTTHDMGFKIYNSYGNGLRLTQDTNYFNIIIQAAKTLSTRFHPKAGCIKSWDNKTKWAYPVIIDNMMNLELLFAATDLTGDSSFYKIAVSHANNTMRDHFRADNSSWHVVDYDTATGLVIKKTTHQGTSDASAWSRGQAWGIYGFTMCYRETRNAAYLQQAEKIASFILSHPRLPLDKVPYWDFDAPKIPKEPRDASAAAIIASALYELSLYSANKVQYLAAADIIVESLTTSAYRAAVNKYKGFLLLHSTGNKPSGSEVDVPLIYADYYYLEALIRGKKAKAGQPLFYIPM